jgi:hypothetical protein
MTAFWHRPSAVAPWVVCSRRSLGGRRSYAAKSGQTWRPRVRSPRRSRDSSGRRTSDRPREARFPRAKLMRAGRSRDTGRIRGAGSVNQVRVVSIAVTPPWARVESNGARLDPTRIRSTDGSAPERRGAVVSRVPRPGTGRSQRAGEPQPCCRSAGPPGPATALPALRRCWPHRQRLAIAAKHSRAVEKTRALVRR